MTEAQELKKPPNISYGTFYTRNNRIAIMFLNTHGAAVKYLNHRYNVQECSLKSAAAPVSRNGQKRIRASAKF